MSDFYFQDITEGRLHVSLYNILFMQNAVNFKWYWVLDSHAYFSALEPRELKKILNLLEQNQAYLPKLIIQASQVNHLLIQTCFLALKKDH